MWLSRFGRTVASHVTDAVSDRLANPLSGAQVTVGGQRVDLAATEDGDAVAQALAGFARALGAAEAPGPEGEEAPGGWLGERGGGWNDAAAASAPRRMTGREMLLGSAFHLARAGDGGGPGLAAWGRVTVGGFEGEAPADDGNVRIDGDVTTGILGADAEWNRLLAGVDISVSEGEGTFAQPGVDKGTIESSLTTVSPYARLRLSERVSAWGLVGFGTGDMTIVQEANDRGQSERVTRTDIKMRLGAVGGRGALLEADETGGIDLALKADAFYVETEAQAVSNEGGTTADASRVRLALEGSRSFETDGGGVLTPGLELGVRHDDGDAETGTGVELGGRVSWTAAGSGLSMEASLRTLVAHEASGYEEWGASGSIRLAPGTSGRGLSFSVAPTWGAPSSGVDRLWSARDAAGLARDGDFEASSRLDAELGYGLGTFGGLLTPYVGVSAAGGSREWRSGARLGLGSARGELSGGIVETTSGETNYRVGVSVQIPFGGQDSRSNARAQGASFAPLRVPPSPAAAIPAPKKSGTVPETPAVDAQAHATAKTPIAESRVPIRAVPTTLPAPATTEPHETRVLGAAPDRSSTERASAPRYRVQLGAFSGEARARRAKSALSGTLADLLAEDGHSLVVDASRGDGLSRVLLAKTFPGRAAATAMCATIAARDKDCYVARSK